MDTYIYLNSSMCLSIAKRALLQLTIQYWNFQGGVNRALWLLLLHNWIPCHFTTPSGIVPQNLLWYAQIRFCYKQILGLHLSCAILLSLYHSLIFSFSHFLPTKYSSWCCFSCFNIFWRHLHCYFLLATELTLISQDLAKELLEMFTASKMAKVFFTNSGSEANDTQVYLLCT